MLNSIESVTSNTLCVQFLNNVCPATRKSPGRPYDPDRRRQAKNRGEGIHRSQAPAARPDTPLPASTARFASGASNVRVEKRPSDAASARRNWRRGADGLVGSGQPTRSTCRASGNVARQRREHDLDLETHQQLLIQRPANTDFADQPGIAILLEGRSGERLRRDSDGTLTEAETPPRISPLLGGGRCRQGNADRKCSRGEQQTLVSRSSLLRPRLAASIH